MTTNYVKIWYSWGDHEMPLTVPNGIDPWEYMKKLAVDECEVAFTEAMSENGCSLRFYPDENLIVLHYDYDDTYCFYKAIEAGSYEEALRLCGWEEE